MAAFTSTAQYIAEHPSAMAMYCSDGRFTRPVEELLQQLGHARLDTLTVPGGPALLVAHARFGDLEALRRAASFLITGHAIRDVFLVAHAGCGYYAARMGAKHAGEIESAQIGDLHAASSTLERAHSGLVTHRFYAHVDAGRVRFEAV